jgi:hypothetical protein
LALEDRIGPLFVIAVAVIEREAGETASEIPLDHAAIHFIERYPIDTGIAQDRDDRLEEVWRNLQQAVGLERLEPRRSHMVEREHRADAATKRRQQHMRATEIERLESRADQAVSKARHGSLYSQRFVDFSLPSSHGFPALTIWKPARTQ